MPPKGKDSKKGEFEQMTVKQLKSELQKRSLSQTGLKAELITRLEQFSASSEKLNQDKKEVMETSPMEESSEKKPDIPDEATTVPEVKEEKVLEDLVQTEDVETETPMTMEEPTRREKEESKRKEPEPTSEEIPVNQAPTSPTTSPVSDQPGKRRKWGSSSSSSSHSVSTDTIKSLLDAESNKDGTAVNITAPKAVTKTPAVAGSKIKGTEKEQAVLQERVVPPSKHPQSRVIHIVNFKRPFTLKQVEELLKQTGNVLVWGMDAIKSQSYCIYENVEQSTKTREALHNLMWPPQNNSTLSADYANENDAKRFFIQQKIALPKDLQTIVPQRNTPAAPPVAPRTRPTASAERKEPERKVVPPPPEPSKTLNDLFLRTTAKPSIYYLPLTDDEVASKKTVAANNSNGNKK